MTAPAPARPTLTATQIRVLNVVRRYVAEHGYAPTVREVGALAGVASKSSVHYQLLQLAAKGVIRREPAKARAIILLDLLQEDAS